LRSTLDVYYLRANTFENVMEDFGENWVTRHLAKILVEAGLPVAIDNPGPNGSHLPAVRYL
jgi:hypothetical protein